MKFQNYRKIITICTCIYQRDPRWLWWSRKQPGLVPAIISLPIQQLNPSGLTKQQEISPFTYLEWKYQWFNFHLKKYKMFILMLMLLWPWGAMKFCLIKNKLATINCWLWEIIKRSALFLQLRCLWLCLHVALECGTSIPHYIFCKQFYSHSRLCHWIKVPSNNIQHH